MEVAQKTKAFYDWYISAMKNTPAKELFPAFVRDANGMTTLDMEVYLSNLRKYQFSKKLIRKEVNTYTACIEHLKKIPFETFNSTFTDLDQFEAIHCDFQNYYHWGGGQEGFDGIVIDRIISMNKKALRVDLHYLSCVDSKECEAWEATYILFTKENGSWKIDQFGN